MADSRPIGVFDSGLGGLSVLRELSLAMPQERFIYLGDIARLPYGTKSQAVVSKYSISCGNFLVQQGIKALVVACNTASALALPLLQKELGIPVIGVIEPGVSAALSVSSEEPILVLATEGTVKSEAYLQAFARRNPSRHVIQLACPLLVPLAEEGWFEHSITESVIQTYLSQVKTHSYGVVLLGCTHYPLLEKSFSRVLEPGKQSVHGAHILAQELHQLLREKNLLTSQPNTRGIQFFSTDRIKTSLPILRALFQEDIHFSLVDL